MTTVVIGKRSESKLVTLSSSIKFHRGSRPMIEENGQLVTNEPVEPVEFEK